VVATLSPDAGTTIHQFDAADRLTGGTDAEGHRAAYAYDAAGRILHQTITDGRSGEESVTVWRYQGQQLVALEHAAQSEHYHHDARGRRVARTVTIMRTDGAETRSVTRYAYSEDGGLESVSLPDGSRITYERNGQGQVVAVKRRRIHTAWLQWLLPAQTIVSDLQRDLVGLQHYRTGNGIEADFQRSREGTLARIVYRGEEAGAATKTAGILDWLAAPAHAIEPPDQATGPLPGALGLPPEPSALLDLRYLWDAQGNLLHLQQRAGSGSAGSYAYDRNDRLIVAVHGERDGTQASRYFYDRQGRCLLSQQDIADQGDFRTNTLKALYQPGTHRWLGEGKRETTYDANGQPGQIGAREYRWDALGRLMEVREGGKTLARYVYNHRGERIAKEAGGHTYFLYREGHLAAELDAKGLLLRQYVHLADAPIAMIDSPQGRPLEGEPRNAWSRVRRDLATILRVWFDDDETVTWLHVNHLGAVEAATGRDGELVWRAHYQPSGQADVVGNRFALNLRLPGQYADAETGLHYNGRRYYDPRRGTYLTPDPLGTPDGPNPYAYVRGNPLRYVDPSGLILFAFDGTNNSNPPPGVDDFSNVYKFYLAYDTDQNGPAWYMNGVGRDDPDSGIQTNWFDDKDANTARARVNYMLGRLDNYMTTTTFQRGEAVDVDIVGFSRGAAMARDFANRVAERVRANAYGESGACLQFRFLGLWDTVAQFGWNGADNSSWQLAIPAEATNVFQAVALNEHRYLFPGEAIGRGTQRGFIGSHADIGGSYGTGDLSDVALNWIYEQAKVSGVKMKTWAQAGNEEWGIVTNPVLHDKSSGSDRDFCLRANNEAWVTNCQKQRDATPGGMTWSQTQTDNLISLYPQSTMDADGSSKIVGEVNMKEYSTWLQQNYGLDIRYQ
jgi:RHS repeat-associated protein